MAKRTHDSAFTDSCNNDDDALLLQCFKATSAALTFADYFTYTNLITSCPRVLTLSASPTDVTLLCVVVRQALDNGHQAELVRAAVRSIQICPDKQTIDTTWSMRFIRMLNVFPNTQVAATLCDAFIVAGVDPNGTICVTDDIVEHPRALELAVRCNADGVAARLVAAGADVTFKPARMSAQLLIDVMYVPSVETLKVLVAAGALVPTGTITTGCLFFKAVYHNRISIVKTLIDHKADVNVLVRPTSTFVISGEFGVKRVVHEGCATPLISFAPPGPVAMLLSGAGADPNLRSADGCTPLDLCVTRAEIRYILLRGGRAGCLKAAFALQIATEAKDEDLVDAVLSAGGHFNPVLHKCTSVNVALVLLAHGVELWRHKNIADMLFDLKDAVVLPVEMLFFVRVLLNWGVMPSDPSGSYRYVHTQERTPSFFESYRRDVQNALNEVPHMVETISHDCRDIIVDYLCPWKAGSFAPMRKYQ